MLSALETAVENGARIVAVNPLREAGLLGFAHPQKISGLLNKATPLASQYLQVRINGDFALLRGLGKELFRRENASPGTVIDQEFVTRNTRDFDAYRSICEAASWDDLTHKCSISRGKIEKLAEIDAKFSSHTSFTVS